MPNAQKTERVAALKERIEGSDALLLAEYRGLSVHDATELRRSLAEQAQFAVVKNTLFERAAGAAGIQDIESLLSGPTAVAFVNGDVVSVAKKIVDAAKKYPALVIKGAYMDGQVLDATAAQALATLESREAMLSKIAGLLKGEMTRAASMFQALQSQFVGLLEAYRDTFPEEAVAEEPAAVAEPEAAEVEAVAETEEESESPEPVAEPSAEAEPEAPEAAVEAEADEGSSPDETEASTNDTGDDSPGGSAAADDSSETTDENTEEG